MQKKEKDPLDISSLRDIDAGDDSGFLGFNKLGLGRELLPVTKAKRDILYTVENYSTTIIVAETGSGKTTQIPQFLVEAGYALNQKCIAITVPRRMAACSVAKRVAEEMNLTLGVEVGYHVRFDNKTSEHTIVNFLTDGMLIKEMMQDPLLQKFSVVMVDDIHERTVATDIILGLLKKIKRKRPELKIIVSSATLNADSIAKFFEDEKHKFKSKVINIEGRLFPVDIFYLSEPCKNYITKSAELALDIHENKPDGDILVFLTGQEEIQSFIEIMNNLGKSLKTTKKIFCVPLYGNMALDSQMDVFNKSPYNTRKIVVSTNLAESSVTIDGIVYVLDCCYVKTKYYDYMKGDESLVVTSVSKASANQRAGRAGRVKAGECYRLCTKSDFEQLYQESSPEICRTNLANIFLQMKALGIGNLAKFEYITTPTEETFVRALEILFSLGALDREGNLTADIGFKLAEMPIDPRLGVILINSGKKEYSCSQEILYLVSMLSAQNIFFANTPSGVVIRNKKKLGAKEGDLITLINIAIGFSRIKNKDSQKRFCQDAQINEKAMNAAVEIQKQLKTYMKKYKIEIVSCDDDPEAIIKCICTGFFDKAAQRQPDGSYISIRGKEKLYLHPQSIMNAVFPSWVTYYEVVRTGKNYMREISKIDPKWLLEVAPHFYQDNKVKIIEDKRKREIDDSLKFEAEHRKKVKTIEQNTKKKKQPQQSFAISDMDYGDSD